MKRLVIDRSKWDRGKMFDELRLTEGADSPCTALRNAHDGRMCCLGIYLNSCGVAKRTLDGSGLPSDLAAVPRVAAWLLLTEEGSSTQVEDLFSEINDSTEITSRARERQLTKLFKQHGVEVTFVGKTLP